MSNTLTISGTPYTPATIDGYTADRETRSIVHPIVGSNTPAVTQQTATLRTGTLTCVFATMTAAQAFADALATGALVTVTSTDLTLIGMTFVTIGSIRIELEDETRNAGIVTVEYQEVTP